MFRANLKFADQILQELDDLAEVHAAAPSLIKCYGQIHAPAHCSGETWWYALEKDTGKFVKT